MSISIILILITIAIVALVDFIPRLLMAGTKPIMVQPQTTRIPKYYIMPTVYGDISYLQNIRFLKRYSDKVIICTSKYESKKFYRDLEQICRQHGFRYIKCDLPIVHNQPVKNAYTIYKGAFTQARKHNIDLDAVAILIDADTYAPKNVNNLVRAFIKQGLDIASMRCEVANPVTIIEKLQAFEYKLAMDNRQVDPWLTSGACNMAVGHVYRKVFRQHSDFFAGGDIEIGKIAQVMGYRIGTLDFTFFTAAPDTFIAWYKQRKIWFAGGIRHHVINAASFGWHHFFMLFYNTLIIYLLLPLRWLELINFPATFFALMLISWLYTYILARNQGWNKYLLLLPLYAFIQSMIIIPAALATYAKLALNQRSLGILKYDLTHNGLAMRGVFVFLNLVSVSVIGYFAVNITSTRVDYWLHHGYIMKFLLGGLL